MYAVVVTGGKQHRVREGDLLRVEKIDGEVGAVVSLDRVLMIGRDEGATIGTPMVTGAVVTAKIVRQGLAKKILVLKKKRRKRFRKMNGHRQPFTHLEITAIKVG
jgi:large subunit ribosomal protein L21